MTVLRVAYFSPLPPCPTGVAAYSAELIPYLAQEVELALFAEDPEAVSADLRCRFTVRHHAHFPRERWCYDVVLYHAGNSDHHRSIYAMLRRYPGATVLHDPTLHHVVVASTLAEDDFPAYVRELAYARGSEGVVQAHAIRRGLAPLPLEWPLHRRVVDLSLGVVVHSEYARARVLAGAPDARVRQIDHLLPLPPVRDQRSARAYLGLPADAFIVVTAGHVIPEKRLDLTLAAFARFHRRHPDALWLIVGGVLPGYEGLRRAIAASPARDAIRVVGYVEGIETFYDYLAAGDVCVNLRSPTVGETSGSVLRAMAVGRPVVVSDVGWYAELPAGACEHIQHDGDEVLQIERVLDRWYDQPRARHEAGRRARKVVAQVCDPTRAAREYARFLREICHSPAVPRFTGR